MSKTSLIGRQIDGNLNKPKRQLAMVFDLNKCLGCQTCTISCKRQWTRDEGMDNQWWAVVNTMPGKGTPRADEYMEDLFDPIVRGVFEQVLEGRLAWLDAAVSGLLQQYG